MSTQSLSRISFHYFEAAGHAEVYNQFRPIPPLDLVKRIVDFLVEKVSRLGIRIGINLNVSDRSRQGINFARKLPHMA
jgi:hypothetical protein